MFCCFGLDQQGADIDGEAGVIRAAIAFPFPPTARPLPLGRMVTTATAITPVTFVFTHGIALQVLGNSKALTSTAKRRMMIAAVAFPFLRRHDSCYWGVSNDGNGVDSGHVRIYAWNSATSAWEQQGADIDGEAAYDQSGRSVSLSSDGTTVAIGAYVTTATASTPVTFVFTHGIAPQVLGNSKALTSTAKRRMIIAA